MQRIRSRASYLPSWLAIKSVGKDGCLLLGAPIEQRKAVKHFLQDSKSSLGTRVNKGNSEEVIISGVMNHVELHLIYIMEVKV